LALLLLSAIIACKPKTPSQYIQPDEMEDILVDYYMARALAQHGADRGGYKQALYEDAVFRQYGVTKEQFDSSLVYYYTRADRFNPVLQRVADRLEERALVLGATEGEIGKYAMLNATGDTANIWAERSAMALLPQPPFNRWEFTIEGDSNFHRGDSFLLQFMSNFVYQGGNKTGVAYLAVDYGDTTVTRSLRFSVSGLSQLRMPEYPQEVRKIRGYFYAYDGHEETTMMRLLFVDNVQLIRFHNHDYAAEAAKDSLQQDSIPRPIGADSLSIGDSVGNSKKLLPLDGGDGPNRVVARVPEPEV